MRVDRKTQAAHRAAILKQAGRLFRRDGIGGVGVAEITRAAGLTHGAFYGHFASKTALAAEACRRSLQDGAVLWRARAARARAAGADPLAAIIDGYLTERHRDQPEDGCALPALGPEIARAEPPLRAALDAGIGALAGVLEEEIAAHRPDLDPAAPARAALAMLSALAGGLILARACANDPERSRAALQAAATMARAAADA
ncbi:TetR/AcrR family transcriptional regulator [Limobrevibacterium gyesilva]|uniref:TetR/AcrR family transcriptional regulator n=1 Tax=Limobrevibacterium gyesilva TaxID=2991712 RepID=A0AA41YU61_9PROT|nr:TetR/AcrR family transcriptional regulator [Limobrevibacterium gyesilva]MCW3476545.1 TetR/AcrR family transcriptional regulator [Limobrevibacterium gyesilva]